MIIPSLNPNDLIVFHFVVSEKSIKLAAEKLCLTQPTVSYHIGTLERSVGTKLIEAKRGTMRLTQAGKELAQYASRIYHDMASAEQFVESLRQPVLRAGIAFTFAVALRSVVPQFEQPNLKEVRLVMKNGASFDIIQDVLNSQLDVGVVVSMDQGNSELKYIPLSNREKMVIVASPFDPIFEKDKIEMADLSGRKFIKAAKTSASHQIILKRLEAEGLKVQASQFETVNNTEWSRYLVESGEALDFLHIKSVEQQISQGRLSIVPVPVDFWIGADAIVRKDTFITKAIDAFISSVKRTFKNPR
jgi:DNA-binding transcriptional LysR family regulator